MPSTFTPEHWSSAAVSYDDHVGQMDRKAISRIIDRISTQHPFTASSYAVDLGSGTGNITMELNSRYPLLKIAAIDISAGMLKILDKKIATNQMAAPKEKIDITTHVLDAADIETHFGQEVFTHVVSTFMLQYTHRPKDVLDAVFESLQEGGSLGIGLWGENNGPIVIWKKACQATDSKHQVPMPHDQMAWTNVDELEAVLKTKFKNVESEVWPLNFGCESAEEVAKFWFEGGNPVPSRLVKAWVDEGGDLESVRWNYTRIAREEYADGKEVAVDAILTTASKN